MRTYAASILITLVLCSHALAGNDTNSPQYLPTTHELTIDAYGSRMPAFMYQAKGAGPHPTIVLMHGLPGNEKNLDLAQDARAAGFNVLFFNYRGAWGAEGEYRLTQLDEDAGAAIQFLRDNAKQLRVDTSAITTLGHSMGGFASLYTGSKDSALKCVGAMSPGNYQAFIDPATGKPYKWLADYADSLFMLAGFNGRVLNDEFAKASQDQLDATLFGKGLSGKSVFMIVGKQDSVTPVSMFDPMANAYASQPDIRLYTHRIDGDHSFSTTRKQLIDLTLDWLNTDCR